MKKLLLLAFSLMAVALNAQSLKWAKQMAGPSIDSGTHLALDGSGNIYTMGTFRYTADFDPSSATFNLTSNGEADIFITKLNSEGEFIWAKQIGAQYYDDEPGNIAVDSNGNIVLAGSFRGTVDLDPGVGEINVSTQGKEAFLVKLDTNGDLIWAKHWGGTVSSDENKVYNLTLDAANNIIIGGGFLGNSDLDPGTGTFNATATYLEDAYLTKFDSNGAFLWAVAFGGDAVDSRDYVNALAADGSGNIIISGPFYGTVTAFSLTGSGIFYIKLDAAGNLIWTKQTESSGNVIYPNSMKLDAAGNAYLIGRYLGTCDFDPGAGVFNLTSNEGFLDIFILKLTASGDFVWATGFGGEGGLDTGYSIELDNLGYLYATGTYGGTADFDPGAGTFALTTLGNLDMFILKLDVDGSFVYANTFGSINGYTIGRSIISDGSGNVYFTGSFQNTTDFDPGSGIFNLVTNGSEDAFVLKLDGATLSILESKILLVSLYPNPSNGRFTIELGKLYQDVTVEISNVLGQEISSEKYASAKTIEKEITGVAGVYFVRIGSPHEGSQTLRIIKQ